MWPKSSLLGAFPSAAFQRCRSAKACLRLLLQRLVLDPRVKNFITPVYLFLKIFGGVGGFGKCSDIRSTIMGWLHHQTMDDFKIIDILNEITCKHVEDIEATLMEFVKEGMVVEVEPDLYVIQRKHLPQPINDFIIEDLKYEGRKENKSIRYNYKVVEGIALEGSFTFCSQCAASGDFLLYGWWEKHSLDHYILLLRLLEGRWVAEGRAGQGEATCQNNLPN